MINPILITGTARSGTSLTASMIYYGGAFGGDMVLPNKNKRLAMLENVQIRKHIVKPYLASIGADRLGQDPLPNLKNFAVVNKMKRDGENGWMQNIESVMEQQGYEKGPWFYKGPKMSFMWPLWHAAFPKAQWVIVHRDKEEIISSCLNTSFMRAFRDRAGWGKWVDTHTDCFMEMEAAGLRILHAYPERMIKGDFREMELLIKALGLNWNEQKAKDLINPTFWNKGGK